MGRFAFAITVSAAGLALGVVLCAPTEVGAKTPQTQHTVARVPFAGIEVPVAKGGPAVLLGKERADIDGDGTVDTVSYFDTDGDEAVDSEVIDLGSTGKASIMALRCDADADGKFDDWLVVDAASEEPRAALIDTNDDGDVDRVAFADGTSEPVDGRRNELFRPVASN